MLVEIGHFALVLALLVALVQGVVPLLGASVRSRALMDLAQPAALLQFALIALAFKARPAGQRGRLAVSVAARAR